MTEEMALRIAGGLALMGAFGFGFAGVYISPLAREPEVREAMRMMAVLCATCAAVGLVVGLTLWARGA